VLTICYAFDQRYPLELDPAVTAANRNAGSVNPNVTSGVPSEADEQFVGFAGWNNTTALTAQNWPQPPNLATQTAQTIVGGNIVNDGTTALTFNITLTSARWTALVIGLRPLVAKRGPFIGVVRRSNSRELVLMIDPRKQDELDDPGLVPAGAELIKVPRADYEALPNFAAFVDLVQNFEKP
jgi:hypothetical protein